MFRYFGMDQEIAITISKDFEGKGLLITPLVILTFVGIGLGVLFALVDLLVEKYVSKE
jgi:hypothetical protein